RGAGAQVALIGLELAHLRHQALAHSGVRGETLVVLTNLSSQVLFLDFQQGLGILSLESGDEKREKSTKQIRYASEHAIPPSDCSDCAANSLTDYLQLQPSAAHKHYPDRAVRRIAHIAKTGCRPCARLRLCSPDEIRASAPHAEWVR